MIKKNSPRFIDEAFEMWINPEIEKRREKGLLDSTFRLYSAQVVINFDKPIEIRLNSEVNALVRGKATRPINKGEEIIIDDDFELIDKIELTQNDPNAGHITLIKHRETWVISFNFKYNSQRVREHFELASQFLQTAKLALNKNYLRVFVDNLFSAIELLAKGTLIMHDKTVFKGKKHSLIKSRYNNWANLGNAQQCYAKLLNKLTLLRTNARYLRKKFKLDSDEAQEMINSADKMLKGLEELRQEEFELEGSD